jgi:gliding motility-associated-like protein
VQEIRNNTVIATQRKDIQITITSCSIAAATLLPGYSLCGDTKTINIANLSNSPLIKTYNWEFIDASGAPLYTTRQQQPNYTFPDTGIYKVKLVINSSDECSDSATTTVKVYPGFVPGFDYSGVCMTKPTLFTDTSVSVYGTVNSWSWDFGDNTGVGNVSNLQDPSYTYATAGIKNVRLIAADSKGCIDTIINTVAIVDKPPLTPAFRDTLICTPDSIQLSAAGNGIFVWSPDIFMNSSNPSTPVVAPPVTTKYYVDLNDNGCLNRDSVIINVVDHVDLQAMADTTICTGDPITLNIISNGLKYSWAPASQLNNAAEKTPVAITSNATVYEVLVAIGSCSAKEDILVSTVDYPLALAGNDTLICFQTSAQLHGFTDGSVFSWNPQASLQFANSLDPVAHPAATTSYVLTANDTKGCPKPGRDTITVTVLPAINAHAGNDTAVVVGQALQLNATGGIAYLWSPATGLSATNIANPTALYTAPSEGILYTVLAYNEAGCVDSASLTVKVFSTMPEVFVPTAFTPNGDGRNDVLKPIAVGMQRIELFNIYNRWGQLVFSTAVNGKGWNGTVNGQQQGAGTYVWMVKAIDYNGGHTYKKEQPC